MKTLEVLSGVGIKSDGHRSRKMASALLAATVTALVLAGAASATTITIPAGVEVTLTEAHFGVSGVCPADSETYGYQLNGSENVTVASTAKTGCPEVAGTRFGPFAVERSLRIWLTDHHAPEYTFYSDGNHALVSGTGPYEVSIMDSGEGHEGPEVERLPPGPDKGNFNVNVGLHALPLVTSVTSDSGPEAGGTSVTIAGSHLSGATAVRFGAVNATTFKVNSPESITATAPAGRDTVDVSVTSAEGTSPTVVGDRFSYLPPRVIQEEEAAKEAAKGLPTVTAVFPRAVLATGGETITFHGANYKDVKAVLFAGGMEKTLLAPSFEVISETEIKAVTPNFEEAGLFLPADAEPLGLSLVPAITDVKKNCVTGAVETTVGTSAAYSDLNGITCPSSGSAPTVAKLSPKKGPAGAETEVTIFGTGLKGVDSVKFEGVEAEEVEEKSATELAVRAPAGSEGTANVVVTTANGTSAESSKDHFKYGKPTGPTVTRVDPVNGPLVGGGQVTVSGVNFAPGMTFAFGKETVSAAECISTSCVVTAPEAKKAGAVNVIAIVGKSKSKKGSADEYTYD